MMVQGDKIMKIIIRYKIDSADWSVIKIPSEQYFDLDDDEEAEIDSVPLHSHAIDYIEHEKEKVVSTITEIIDPRRHKKRKIITTYWNNQQNSVTERVDSGLGYCDREQIVVTKIQDVPSMYEIIRFVRKDEAMVPIYHGFITDNEDGSQTENRIY
jgi:hypothetical protein